MNNFKENHEDSSPDKLIDTLIDSSKLKYRNDQKALNPIDYLQRLYKQCDREKIENGSLTKSILRCQKCVYDADATLDDFAESLLKIIEYLRPFKTKNLNRIKLNKIELEPSPTTKKNTSQSFEFQNKPNIGVAEETKKGNEKEKSVAGDEEDEDEDEREEGTLTKAEIKALSHIKKLDEFCQKLSCKITEFEKAEVSLDDMDSNQSKYIQEETLKKRFKKAYEKLVSKMREYPQLVDVNKMPKLSKKSDRSFRKLTEFNATRFSEVNEKVQKKLNELKEFPDFLEVVEWITEANNESELSLSQEMIEKLAKNSFEAIGRHLKKSRYADLIQIQTSRIRSLEPEVLETESDDNVFAKVDPALKEPKIDKILKENKRIAEEKLHDIFEEYSRKQANNEDFEDEEDDDDDDDEEEDDENDEDFGNSKEKEYDEQDSVLSVKTNISETSTEEITEEHKSIISVSPLKEKATNNKDEAVALLVQSVLKTKPTDSKKRESIESNEMNTNAKKMKSEKNGIDSTSPTTSKNALNTQKKKVSNVSLRSTRNTRTSLNSSHEDSLSCIVID